MRNLGNSYEPTVYEEPRGEKRSGDDIEKLQDNDTAIMVDTDDLEMGYICYLKDARDEQRGHTLMADNLESGHLLVVTEGAQVKHTSGKDGISKARYRVKWHADKVIGNMKIHDEMTRYFIHRDLEGGVITRDPCMDNNK